MNKSHRNIKGERLTDPYKVANNAKKHDIKPIQAGKRPEYKPNKSIMSRVIQFLKRAGSLIVGVATGGTSLFAGFDPSTSLLIAVSAAMLVLGVELAVVKEFKQLFEEDE